MEKTIEWNEWFVAASSANDDAADYNKEDQLIRAAAAGDEDAFRRLVEQYQDQVYRFAYQWLLNVDDAREVCQDTFVRVYQALGRYSRKGKFSTWLYRIAWNLCRDRTRKKSHRQQSVTGVLEETDEIQWHCSKASPDESTGRKEELQRVLHGIEMLPDQLKCVVILCGFEGMSQEAVADILKCSVRAVEGRLYRARKMLAEWQEEGRI